MNGEEIKKRRKELKISQAELGELLGVGRRTIINYEKGEDIPDTKSAILHNILFNDDNTDINQALKKTTEHLFPKSQQKGVPYYDVDFTASFLEVENNQNTLPNSYITHPFFLGCDFVVRASGQSMAKVIKHGDAVGLVKIDNWREFIPLGEIYAIVTSNGFRMVKVITKGETDNCYTLVSKPTDNKKDEFPDQQIKKDLIQHIYKVQASSHLF